MIFGIYQKISFHKGPSGVLLQQRKNKKMTDPIRCAILVCSDRCSTGESEDRSGATLKQILEAKPLNGVVLELKIVPGRDLIFDQQLRRFNIIIR